MSSVDILSIINEDKLNLNQYIDIICISTSNQLKALIRVKYFLETEGRKVTINSFESTLCTHKAEIFFGNRGEKDYNKQF